MARIRNSSGLEVVKVSFVRRFLRPGELIVGTLDWRDSFLAAAAAFEMNYPDINLQDSASNPEKRYALESDLSIDPYVCSQYCASLIATEKSIDINDESNSIESSKSSLNLPTSSSTRLLKSASMEHISETFRASKSLKKPIIKHMKNEAETIKATTADVVFGADVVGFRLQIPKDISAPTFTTTKGKRCIYLYKETIWYVSFFLNIFYFYHLI